MLLLQIVLNLIAWFLSWVRLFTPKRSRVGCKMINSRSDVRTLAQIPVGSALIVDGMAFIPQIHTMSSTCPDHEEVGKRLLLHAHQATQVFSRVIIKNLDTYVMVLSMVKSQDFHRCLLLFMTGSDSNNRIINITQLGIKPGQEKCQTILALHIFLHAVTA